MEAFDSHLCSLGEGPLWHPGRATLFWFDILGKRLLARKGDHTQVWDFDRHHSAAGWVDQDTLLLASEDALWRFNLETGARVHLVDLEAETPATRSNDGRADPWGGFWIGTMGKRAERQAGAIYRFFRGELRRLVPDITISNAICFAPDRSCAYYTDTMTRRIMRQPLERATGWPEAAPEVLVDLRDAALNPDGAVTDADGNLWVAMWGAACVVCFDTQGAELRRIVLPVLQPTCPAFGGPALRDLYVTSASDGLDAKEMKKWPLNGATLRVADISQGLPEPQVIL